VEPAFDWFTEMSYEQAEEIWPTLTPRVFNVLRGITPRQFAFELKEMKLTFNVDQAIDRDTYVIISTILSNSLEEPNVLMTHGDLQFSYSRLARLIYLFEGVRQGIFVEKMIDEKVAYVMPRPPRRRYVPQTQFITPPFVQLYWK
jgi:hypothetical protein